MLSINTSLKFLIEVRHLLAQKLETVLSAEVDNSMARQDEVQCCQGPSDIESDNEVAAAEVLE